MSGEHREVLDQAMGGCGGSGEVIVHGRIWIFFLRAKEVCFIDGVMPLKKAFSQSGVAERPVSQPQ